MGWIDNITGECLKQALGLIFVVLSVAAGAARWLIRQEQKRTEAEKSRADKAEEKLERFMLDQQQKLQNEIDRLRSAGSA